MTLPRAGVVRCAKAALPAALARRGLSGDAAVVLNEAGDAFVQQVAARAHALTESVAATAKRKRSTVGEDHVAAALKELDAPAAFLEGVRSTSESEVASGEARKAVLAKKKRRRAKVTPEEQMALAAEQEALFKVAMGDAS